MTNGNTAEATGPEVRRPEDVEEKQEKFDDSVYEDKYPK